MSNERFIPAQPGYKVWSIVEASGGKRYAYCCGDVVAWHMVYAMDSGAEDGRFVAMPVTVHDFGGEYVVMVDDDPRAFTEGSASTFDLWLRGRGLLVSVDDADLARRLYRVPDDLIEAET